jgi:hypothetical protein
MPKKPLYVAFLWHMPQPDYRGARTGEPYLPWARFHFSREGDFSEADKKRLISSLFRWISLIQAIHLLRWNIKRTIGVAERLIGLSSIGSPGLRV